MAATTISNLTDEQKRLLENYDPALINAGLADLLQDIIDTLNAHASEIDLKADAP